MERAIGRTHEQRSQQQAREIAQLLREAQQICLREDSEPHDPHTRQLFTKIAALLDDVLGVLARYESQRPPSRTLH